MSWTEITRPQYRRDDLRYASDLRDGEWLMLSPLLDRPRLRNNPSARSSSAINNLMAAFLFSAPRAPRSNPAHRDG